MSVSMSVEPPSFNCGQCSFRSLTWRELTRHRFETHSNEPNFLEKCVVEGCSETFHRYSSFLSHLSRKHRGIDMESAARRSICPIALEAEEDRVADMESNNFSDSLSEGRAISHL